MTSFCLVVINWRTCSRCHEFFLQNVSRWGKIDTTILKWHYFTLIKHCNLASSVNLVVMLSFMKEFQCSVFIFDIRSVGTVSRIPSRRLCVIYLCLCLPYWIGLVWVGLKKRSSLLVPARNLPCSRVRVVGVGGVGVVGDEGLCVRVCDRERERGRYGVKVS